MVEQDQSLNVYYLEPGFVYVSETPLVIRTVLGSCVAVCLWDREKKIGGMNHFLYPRTKSGDKKTSKYGNVAMITLLRILKNLDCSLHTLEAQVFGGASPSEAKDSSLGKENSDTALAFLQKQQITVISQDVGGCMGRKIVFDITTGNVVVFKVHAIRTSDWITYGN